MHVRVEADEPLIMSAKVQHNKLSPPVQYFCPCVLEGAERPHTEGPSDSDKPKAQSNMACRWRAVISRLPRRAFECMTRIAAQESAPIRPACFKSNVKSTKREKTAHKLHSIDAATTAAVTAKKEKPVSSSSFSPTSHSIGLLFLSKVSCPSDATRNYCTHATQSFLVTYILL